jgi:hypothetical protein
MSDTAATEVATVSAPPPLSGMPRLAAEIDPANVQIQVAGQCWTEWLVRLPAEAIFADLADPRIWRRNQQSRVALVKGDRVRIVSWDEAWCCECLVAGANDESVSLTKPQRYDLQARVEILAGDDKYQILWVGNGYRVQRRSDQQFVSGIVATKGLAEIALRNMYPQHVTGRM